MPTQNTDSTTGGNSTSPVCTNVLLKLSPSMAQPESTTSAPTPPQVAPAAMSEPRRSLPTATWMAPGLPKAKP